MALGAGFRAPSADRRGNEAISRPIGWSFPLSSPIVTAVDFPKPVLKDVVHGLLQRDLRGPPQFVTQTTGIAQQQRDIIWTKTCGIDLDANGHARARDEQVQHIPNRDGAPRADVVRAPGPASLRD